MPKLAKWVFDTATHAISSDKEDSHFSFKSSIRGSSAIEYNF